MAAWHNTWTQPKPALPARICSGSFERLWLCDRLVPHQVPAVLPQAAENWAKYPDACSGRLSTHPHLGRAASPPGIARTPHRGLHCRCGRDTYCLPPRAGQEQHCLGGEEEENQGIAALQEFARRMRPERPRVGAPTLRLHQAWPGLVPWPGFLCGMQPRFSSPPRTPS